MYQKKDFGNVEVARGIDANDHSADLNGPSVDLRGYGGAVCIVSIGDTATALTASNRMRVKVQHSNTGTSGWSDVGHGGLVGPDVSGNHFIVVVDTPTTDEDIVRYGAYVGGRRYVRAVLDETGTVSNLGVSAVWMLTRAQYA